MLIERSWIIEIDEARCPKLICEHFQIAFLRPDRNCASLLLNSLRQVFYLSGYTQHEQVA